MKNSEHSEHKKYAAIYNHDKANPLENGGGVSHSCLDGQKRLAINRRMIYCVEGGSSPSSGVTITVGSNPDALAVDSSGNVWVANHASGNVTEFIKAAKGPEYFPYSGPQWP